MVRLIAMMVLLTGAAALAQYSGDVPPTSGPAAVDPAPASQPGEPPTLRPRANPLPGIAIDKPRRRVAVDCHTLQPGADLELIACLPNTREHEAVVKVNARPQQIHLALLLCGFAPGEPAHWDPKTEKQIPATGDPIDVLVEWTDADGAAHTAPIERWIRPIDPAKPMPDLRFVFAGSRQGEDGLYWADAEGSVISLTNFEDAVIDLAGIHSRDQAALSFASNAKTMPPANTPCKLVLLPPAALRVELDRFGKIAVGGRPLSPRQLSDLLARHRKVRDDARVELVVSPEAVAADVERLVEQARQAGFEAGRIDRHQPTTQPGAFVFPTNDPQAAIDLLTGQWREHRQLIDRSMSAQRQWFAQLEDRRQVLGRQFDELTRYLDQASAQYRRQLADIGRDQ